MISIFAYDDYRSYIRDVYKFEKRSSSLRLKSLAEKANMSSSLLKMILDGRRNLTGEKLHQFAKAMRLADAEWDYFECLVRRDNSTDPLETEYYNKRIGKYRDCHQTIPRFRTEKEEILSQWYLPALLIYVLDFAVIEGEKIVVDTDKVAKNVGCHPQQIASFVDWIKDEGFLKVDSKKGVQIRFDKVLGNYQKKTYLKKIIELMKTRIESHFLDKDHHFETGALTLDKNQYRQFSKDIQAVVDKYAAAEKTPDGHVAQYFYSIVPVIK